MKMAIITTVFNEGGNISRFLSSILFQSEMPDTVVIVDGGSKDDTFSKAQSFKERFKHIGVQFVLKSQPCNIAQGRNIAIAATDAEIICVTDAGVTLDPGWFREISRPLREEESIDYVGGNFEIGGEKGVQRALRVIGYKNKATNNPSSRSFAFRRICWQTYPYPEHLKVHEDTKLCDEWRRRGFRFGYAPRACVVWVAEDSLLKIYRKFRQYAEWSTRSGDCIDTMRKLQIASYVLALIATFHAIAAGLLVVLASLLVRVVRQYLRVYRASASRVELRLLHWALLVQLTLDAAALAGTLRGYWHLLSRGRVA